MATDVSFAAPVAHSPTHEDHPLVIDVPRMLPAGCWTLSVLSLFCLFLVDNASLLALFALSFCDLRMGLRVGLWNHILGFRLVVGHNSPPVSGVNVTSVVRFLCGERRRTTPTYLVPRADANGLRMRAAPPPPPDSAWRRNMRPQLYGAITIAATPA